MADKPHDVRLAVIRLNLSVPEHAEVFRVYQGIDASRRGEWLRYHLMRSVLAGAVATSGSGVAEQKEAAIPELEGSGSGEPSKAPPFQDFLKQT